MTRADKQTYMEDLASQAEWAKRLTIEAEAQYPDTDLDVSKTLHQRKKKSWQPSDPSKAENPRDRTASMQNSSRQSQSLQHKFFSHSLQQYEGRNNYLTTE